MWRSPPSSAAENGSRRHMSLARITTEFELRDDDGHGDPWMAATEINEALSGSAYRLVEVPGPDGGVGFIVWEDEDD